MNLTSLASVKEYLEIEVADVSRDLLLTGLITSVSAAIRTFTGRRFTVPATPETRTFYLGGVILDADELVTITQASNDAGSLAPVVDGVTAYGFLVLRFPAPPMRVDITGSYGWSSVPADVAEAARQTIAVWYQRDVANITRRYSTDGGTEARGLPSAARDLLEPYRLDNGAGVA